MREYVLLQLKVRAMRDLLFRSRIFSYLAAATPGLRELVTIGKIWELAQTTARCERGARYDLVIVDAPATGHGVGFLQTPRTFANIARVGPIKRPGARRSTTFIVNHRKTGVAIVALPEEMPVNETRRRSSATLTEEVGVAVDRVVLNGLYPERFSRTSSSGSTDGRARRPTAPLRGRRAGRRWPRAAGPRRSASSSRASRSDRARRRCDAPVPVRARARRRARSEQLAERRSS